LIVGQSKPIGTKIILIVEDEAIIRFDLVDYFLDAGWRVFDVPNAERAIAVLEERTDIRVVLTDVQMPGEMDGIRLAHYVRDRYPPTVLFVMSGAVPIRKEELPARAMFLPKPYDPQRLLRLVEAEVH